MLRKMILTAMAAILVSGCARVPMKLEFFEPVTMTERERGYGAIKYIDYTKPNAGITLFGFSLW